MDASTREQYTDADGITTLPTAQEMFEAALAKGDFEDSDKLTATLKSLSPEMATLYSTMTEFAFTEGQNDLDTGGEEDLFVRFRTALDDGKYADPAELCDALNSATKDQETLLDTAMEYAYEEGRSDFPD